MRCTGSNEPGQKGELASPASDCSAGSMREIVSSDGAIMNLSCGHWLMLADGEDATFLVGASTKCRVCERQNSRDQESEGSSESNCSAGDFGGGD